MLDYDYLQNIIIIVVMYSNVLKHCDGSIKRMNVLP